MKKTWLKATSMKTLSRNHEWRKIVLERAEYLRGKYGVIVCEYSGETIRVLSSVAIGLDDGWGHHIDHNRNNCTPDNCYIVKYKYHRLIHDNNIKVKQEGFERSIRRNKLMPATLRGRIRKGKG